MTLDLPAIRARAEEAEALRAMMLKKDVRPECEGKSRCCGPWVLVEPAIILTVREQDEVMYSLGQANDDRAALLAEVERLRGEVARLGLAVTHEGPEVTKRVMDRAIAARPVESPRG